VTNQEMLKYLKGSIEDKKTLFNHFLARVMGGSMLADHEIGMFEFLKKELLVESPPVILEMSASMKGAGGVKN
jgi:hypothetical protein